MQKPNPPDSAVHVSLFVVTWNSITLHQHWEKTHTFAAISSCICSLPAADSVLSLSLNQMKASELQVTADRSLASAWESHNLTSSLLNIPLCAAYNDPFMLYSCRCYLFVANVAKKEESAKDQNPLAQKGRDVLSERGNSLQNSLSLRQLFCVLSGKHMEPGLEKHRRLSLQK